MKEETGSDIINVSQKSFQKIKGFPFEGKLQRLLSLPNKVCSFTAVPVF